MSADSKRDGLPPRGRAAGPLAERDCATLRQQLDRLTRELHARDERLSSAELETRRLRRERVDARKALLDAEDAARERELLIRDAALQQQRDAARAWAKGARIGIDERARPGPLLTNLREHNGMLLSLLTNLLKQQSAQRQGA
eukprot:gene15799-5890_t